MKHFFQSFSLILVFCTATIGLYAQPAPDFTITTSNGNTFKLYDDYLDKGKTVVIKLFFTYCPPCNAIAPQMEPFYQKWGAGMGSVEMVSLSTKNNDPNSDVAAYKKKYGHTFPGAGADGGSVAATLPYINNSYGFFLGTPTFIVIAPDGTVTYDPRGSGNFSSTLDAISTVLSNLGNVPMAPFTVKGSVKTAFGQAVPNTNISVPKLNNLELQTDENGEFLYNTFIHPDSTYSIQISMPVSSISNGVDVIDLLQIQKHLLTSQPFDSPYKLLAADADRSGEVNVIDILQLARALINPVYSIPNSETWLLLDSGLTFNNPGAPFQQAYSHKFQAGFSSADGDKSFNILAIKTGDTDGSATFK